MKLSEHGYELYAKATIMRIVGRTVMEVDINVQNDKGREKTFEMHPKTEEQHESRHLQH